MLSRTRAVTKLCDAVKESAGPRPRYQGQLTQIDIRKWFFPGSVYVRCACVVATFKAGIVERKRRVMRVGIQRRSSSSGVSSAVHGAEASKID